MPQTSSQSATEETRGKTLVGAPKFDPVVRLRFDRPADYSRYSPVPHRVATPSRDFDRNKSPEAASLVTQSQRQTAIYYILRRDGVPHPQTKFEWTYTGALSQLATQVRALMSNHDVAKQTILNDLNRMAARHEIRIIPAKGKYPAAYVVLNWDDVEAAIRKDSAIGKDETGHRWYIGRGRRYLSQDEIEAWKVHAVYLAAEEERLLRLRKPAKSADAPTAATDYSLSEADAPPARQHRPPPSPIDVAKNVQRPAVAVAACPKAATKDEIEGVLGAIPRYLHRDRKIAVKIIECARTAAPDCVLEEVLEAMRRGISGSPRIKYVNFFLEAVPGHIEMVVEQRAERAAEAEAYRQRAIADEHERLEGAREQWRKFPDTHDDLRIAWPGIDFGGDE